MQFPAHDLGLDGHFASRPFNYYANKEYTLLQ